MSTELLVSVKVERTKFNLEDYIPSDHIFALVASGSFKFTAEGKSYKVSAGEGVLFKKNILYHREIVDPAVIYFFRYKSDSPIFQNLKITFKDNARIRSTISLLECLDNRILKNDFEYRTRLFLDIVTQYELENGSDLDSASDSIGEAIDDIRNFACRVASQKINLAQVAAKTGLTYIRFARRFKQKTGMTPIEYVSTLRLQKAKHLLSETEIKIREIATLCGFENEYYFSNFFKKQTALSPRTYRKMSKED